MSKSTVTYKSVWETLSQYDVNEHTEKRGSKGGFQATYLSWAWAWGIMMKHYPQMQISFTQYAVSENTEEMTDVLMYENRTCQVECTVRIDDVNRTMWLPVMDNTHKAVVSPSSTQINTAKMRCMTKCFALLGLGHYIFAGEDIPPVEEEKPKKAAPKKTTKKSAAKPKEMINGTTPHHIIEEKKDEGITNSQLGNVLTEVLDDVAARDEKAVMTKYLKDNAGHELFNADNQKAIAKFVDGVNDSTPIEVVQQWYDRVSGLIDKGGK
tara:strand:- start:7653 stop:8453 length:801 start_codon:yes stop_codon:yes gene_type:complete